MTNARHEWLDSSCDGSLDEESRLRLEAELTADPQLRAEQAGWSALHRLLREDRVPIRPGFHERVMAALPLPAWQKSSAPRIYPVLVAALLACTLGATFLLSGLAEQPLAGTGLALADFLQTTLLAGSGLLAATWTGLGFGLEKLFATSGATLAAFTVLVACLNLLFISLLRRGPAAAARKSNAG